MFEPMDPGLISLMEQWPRLLDLMEKGLMSDSHILFSYFKKIV